MFNTQKPLLMGILNVTADSFADGGQYTNLDLALAHAHKMIKQGADIIDIGGESTRPGAQAVSVQQELDSVIPVIEGLSASNPKTAISIDSSKREVMAAALDAGAVMVNDVCALTAPGTLELVAESAAWVCLMHMQGSPRTMQDNPHYDCLLEEVTEFLKDRINACEKAGIKQSKMIVDPGFGFGKNLQHNLILLKKLEYFKALGLPILVGLSRKSMIGTLLGLPVEQRLAASLACAAIAIMNGARIIRVHDVAETRQVIDLCTAVREV